MIFMDYYIEKMKIEELQATLNLVKTVFDEFEAPDYRKEGIKSFYKFADYDSMIEKLNQNLQIFIAKDNNEIIGTIAIRDYSHIAMLFVKKEYHKKRIASALLKEAKFYCRQNNREITNITVNSSPYAIEFYHKKGFIDTDAEKLIDGIKFTPMKLDIYSFKKYEEKDFDYLYKTKKDCFKWYVEKLYGDWNDEFQIKLYREFIEKQIEHMNIITYQNQIIGVFTNYIDENNESVIDLFYIDKNYQGRGIGKEILEEQLRKDKNNGRNTRLQVFKENPAKFLYQKVGFEIYDETESHFKMRRKLK